MSDAEEQVQASETQASETQDSETTGEELEQQIEEATEAVSVQTRQLDELGGGAGEGDPIGLDNLLEVPVKVTVQVGRARMSLGDLVKLAPGSLVHLDREAHEPADILVNGKIVARGEVVTIDEMYGVRITSVESM